MGWGRDLVKQNAKERGGSEDCFVFTSWLVGGFDFFLTPCSCLLEFQVTLGR